MHVALSNRDGAMPSNSGKHENIPALPLPGAALRRYGEVRMGRTLPLLNGQALSCADPWQRLG